MTALSNAFLISKSPALHFTNGSYVKSADQCLASTNLAFGIKGTSKSVSQMSSLVVHGSFSDGGRPSSTSAFVGGFILAGLIVGMLGCVYVKEY